MGEGRVPPSWCYCGCIRFLISIRELAQSEPGRFHFRRGREEGLIPEMDFEMDHIKEDEDEVIQEVEEEKMYLLWRCGWMDGWVNGGPTGGRK